MMMRKIVLPDHYQVKVIEYQLDLEDDKVYSYHVYAIDNKIKINITLSNVK